MQRREAQPALAEHKFRDPPGSVSHLCTNYFSPGHVALSCCPTGCYGPICRHEAIHMHGEACAYYVVRLSTNQAQDILCGGASREAACKVCLAAQPRYKIDRRTPILRRRTNMPWELKFDLKYSVLRINLFSLLPPGRRPRHHAPGKAARPNITVQYIRRY